MIRGCLLANLDLPAVWISWLRDFLLVFTFALSFWLVCLVCGC